MGSLIAATFLSGCLETDLERGAAGAAAGVATASVLGGSLLGGAVIGGAAGVLCDDIDLCTPSR